MGMCVKEGWMELKGGLGRLERVVRGEEGRWVQWIMDGE
jgi:hypothetical protein